MVTPKTFPLAVYSPWLGWPAMQYVRRHIEDILPGRTVAVSVAALENVGPAWSLDCPSIHVNPLLDPTNTPFDSRDPVYDSLPTEHLQKFSTPDHIASLKRFLEVHEVEVILAQWAHESLPLLQLARDMNIRYYVQVHGSDITSALNHDEIRASYAGYRDADGAISPSEFGKRQLVELGFDPTHVHVVRHGISAPVSPPEKEDGPIRCLAVGRMEAMKDPLGIIQTFARFAREYPDARLDYAGSGTMASDVADHIKRNHLENVVVLHGPLGAHQVRELMSVCHVLIHPSASDPLVQRYDTCPVAVVEAMAHGMAIVGTRHGGIPEEVTDGVEGFLCDERDYPRLATKLSTLADDPAMRQEMGHAAWLTASQRYSVDRMQRRMQAVLGLAINVGSPDAQE